MPSMTNALVFAVMALPSTLFAQTMATTTDPLESCTVTTSIATPYGCAPITCACPTTPAPTTTYSCTETTVETLCPTDCGVVCGGTTSTYIPTTTPAPTCNSVPDVTVRPTTCTSALTCNCPMQSTTISEPLCPTSTVSGPCASNCADICTTTVVTAVPTYY